MSIQLGTPIRGHSRVRKFTDTHGFFFEVELTVTPGESEDRAIKAEDLPPRLLGSVQFGVDYALGLLGHERGWTANVTLCRHHAIDSSPEVAALATAQAILLAVGHEPTPYLDVEKLGAVFPK